MPLIKGKLILNTILEEDPLYCCIILHTAELDDTLVSYSNQNSIVLPSPGIPDFIDPMARDPVYPMSGISTFIPSVGCSVIITGNFNFNMGFVGFPS